MKTIDKLISYINERRIRDIAVACPMKDLTKGVFPREITTVEYTNYIGGFSVKSQETGGWLFSVACNVMNIKPQKEWIDKLEYIFPKDKWKACAVIEKLYEDGDGLPRLVFFETNEQDK